MAALISSVMDTKDKVPFFVAQTEQMGIEILPPDVNLSDHEFVVVEGNIRFGLDAVKGVGYQAVEAIKRAREEGGPFTSIWDFCARVDCRAVNKQAIEALIKCGAFGSTGATRKGMLEVLEQAQAAGPKPSRTRRSARARSSTWRRRGAARAAPRRRSPRRATRRSRPRSSTSPSCSPPRRSRSASSSRAHPLKEVREAMRLKVDAPLAELSQRKDGDWVTVGGIITQCKKIRTKKGDPMMFATLDDLEGSVEILIFGKALSRVRGRARRRRGRARPRPRRPQGREQDRASSSSRSSPSARPRRRSRRPRPRSRSRRPGPRPFCLRVDASRLPATVIDELKEVLDNFPGESDVVLEMTTRGGRRTLRLGPSYRVSANSSLNAELDHLLGPAVLSAAPEPQAA